jgi:copper homeostasis protein (lipoprotein)
MRYQPVYRFGLVAVLVCTTLFAGCNAAEASDNSSATVRLSSFPASFEGELPCADCQGVFYHLDLFEDRVFFLRTMKIGHVVGAVTDAIGSWEMASDSGHLTLFGGWESPMFFRVLDPTTLRKIDAEGQELEPRGKYDLALKSNTEPIEPRLVMRGMYSYYADAALFEECLSGRRLVVAMEADNIALERAYLENRSQPGEKVLVSLQGRLAERPAMEGDSLELTVVPERYIGIWPGENCGPRGSISEVEDTYLKLTRLGSQRVPVVEGEREPHIVLHSQENRIAGTGGCNQFSGGYEIDGQKISFGPMATTMMACPGAPNVDLAMMAALEKAVSFSKTAHHLELVDGEGAVVARFEARELQ